MFLIERLVGLGIYCYFLAATCLLIAFSKIKLKNIAKFYTLALAVMGFFYEPYKTADLYRINESLHQFSNYTFSGFFNTFVKNSSVPAARIYYWLISKTGVFELLPAVTCIICYSCIFYAIVRAAEIYKIDRKSIAVAVFFFMSTGNYIMVISNIRTMLAISLIFFCMFRETVEKKYRPADILLYVIAAFTHNIAMIIIAIRMIVIVFNRKTPLIKRLALVAVFAVAAVFMVARFGNIFNSIFEKAMSYITEGGYSYIWDYIVGVLAFLIELIVLIRCFKSKKDCSELVSMNIFLTLCTGIALVFCYEFSIFHRFTVYISPVLCLAQLMFCMKPKNEKKVVLGVIHLRDFVFIISAAMLILACMRGSLCSLKFFVL